MIMTVVAGTGLAFSLCLSEKILETDPCPVSREGRDELLCCGRAPNASYQIIIGFQIPTVCAAARHGRHASEGLANIEVECGTGSGNICKAAIQRRPTANGKKRFEERLSTFDSISAVSGQAVTEAILFALS